MAITVAVPKDLSGIKTKVALNLTKRQIICFTGAIVTAGPAYFLTKGVLAIQEILINIIISLFALSVVERAR